MQYRLNAGGHASIEADKLAGLDAAVEAFQKACEDAGVVLKIDVQAIPQTDDETKQVAERATAAAAKAEKARQAAGEKFQEHGHDLHPWARNPQETKAPQAKDKEAETKDRDPRTTRTGTHEERR